MNLRDLQYLVALSEHQHFGKAARASFVSQPALSMQIKKLEMELGVSLIERRHKTFLLTETGNALVERARAILQQVKELKTFAKQKQDPYSGELKLGIFPTIAPYLLPRVIKKWTHTFPKLAFFIVEEKTGVLIEQLHQGKIDVAIAALPLHRSEFTEMPLFTEEFSLAVGKQNPLAKRKYIEPKDLIDRSLLLLEEGHCLREHALSFCHRVHAKEVAGFRASSLETLRHMVAMGLGITLIPKLAQQAKDNVVYIPFRAPQPSRTIGMVWRKSSAKEKVLREIGSCVATRLARD